MLLSLSLLLLLLFFHHCSYHHCYYHYHYYCSNDIMLVQGVDILTLGQYLQPTPLHLPVREHVTPDQFEHWRNFGEDVVGFRYKCWIRCMCYVAMFTHGLAAVCSSGLLPRRLPLWAEKHKVFVFFSGSRVAMMLAWPILDSFLALLCMTPHTDVTFGHRQLCCCTCGGCLPCIAWTCLTASSFHDQHDL